MSFADQISKDRGQPATVRIGVVATLAPLTVDVQATRFTKVGAISGYSPAVGDVVAMLGQSAVSSDGSSWLVLGQIVDSSNIILNGPSAYTPVMTSSGGGAAVGDGTLTGRYVLQQNGLVYTQIRLTRGATTTFGAGFITFTLPPIPALSIFYCGAVAMLDASANSFSGACQLETVTSVTPLSSAGVITNASPFAWAVNDRLLINIVYEAA
jgi:hypothetical protein